MARAQWSAADDLLNAIVQTRVASRISAFQGKYSGKVDVRLMLCLLIAALHPHCVKVQIPRPRSSTDVQLYGVLKLNAGGRLGPFQKPDRVLTGLYVCLLSKHFPILRSLLLLSRVRLQSRSRRTLFPYSAQSLVLFLSCMNPCAFIFRWSCW